MMVLIGINFCRNEIQAMVMEHQVALSSCSVQISSLENQLADAKVISYLYCLYFCYR